MQNGNLEEDLANAVQDLYGEPTIYERRIVEEEFASLYGRTVKLHLKEPDGTFKNHYHHYKTEEKAQKMYEHFQRGLN